MAALVLFCALPLGGCIALVSFGISEVNERKDEVAAVADEVIADALAGDADALLDRTDGGTGCEPPDVVVATLLAAAEGATEWRRDDVSFVERDDNSTFSNVTDSEDFVVAGREDESTAAAEGVLGGPGTSREIQLTFLKPVSTWR